MLLFINYMHIFIVLLTLSNANKRRMGVWRKGDWRQAGIMVNGALSIINYPFSIVH